MVVPFDPNDPLIIGPDEILCSASEPALPTMEGLGVSAVSCESTDFPSDSQGGSATPPVRISGQPRVGTGKLMQDDIALGVTFTAPVAVAERLAGRAARKKKRAAKKKNEPPAMSTQLGFTPVTSGDEDSDISSPYMRGRAGSSTIRSSSVVRKDLNLNLGVLSGTGLAYNGRSSSPSPGISTLSQQFDSISIRSRSGSERPPLSRCQSKLTSTTSSASVSSAVNSDDDMTDTTTIYEVPVEHDFISSDIGDTNEPNTGTFQNDADDIVRKMHATDFQSLRCLGKGTYGTVLLVKQISTGKLYAQKQFRKASLTVRKHLVEQTKTERAILESINRHPFVVKLYYAFQDQEKLYLILEYAQGGELFERMRTEHMFPEETAAFYMAEMVLALEHLHQTVGVVYRDLKPENCLLDAEGHLLLTDFGLSKVAAEGDECRSMTGTMEYMAPEVIQELQYGTAVDWWSFGILGVDLLTGSTPFHAQSDMKIREKILKAKLALPYYLSPDAKDLLTRLLRKEPKKRLGSTMPKDLQTMKKHRFFRKIDWHKLELRQVDPPIRPLVTDPELAENFSSEFTDLALSPVADAPLAGLASVPGAVISRGESDPFGGFSFVGSRSLLEEGLGCF